MRACVCVIPPAAVVMCDRAAGFEWSDAAQLVRNYGGFRVGLDGLHVVLGDLDRVCGDGAGGHIFPKNIS